MSNLKFKSKTDPMSLRKFLDGRSAKQLAYATTVTDANGLYLIAQHDNTIAGVQTWTITIDMCGWDSSTTRNRLNMILRDNNIPARVGQKDYDQKLTVGDTTYGDFRYATFTMSAGEWHLNNLNGVPIQ